MKKNKFLLFLSILLSLSSCDKVKSDQKKLDGTWNVIEYEFTNPSSLKYQFEASGTMAFSNFSENKNDYSLDITYVENGTTNYKIENGSMEIEDNGEYFKMYRINSNQTISTIENCRIILITKTDLKIFFGDELGNHELIFEK